MSVKTSSFLLICFWLSLLPLFTSAAVDESSSSGSCVNVAGWSDRNGLSCSDYESNSSMCESVSAIKSFNADYNAKLACCSCGGGLLRENMIFQEATDIPLRPIRPTLQGTVTPEPCLDRQIWSTRIGNITATCSSFDFRTDLSKEMFSCEEYGHFKDDVLGVASANDVCCKCSSTGGYNGTLLGRTFRVTFPDDADARYTLYTNTSSIIGDSDSDSPYPRRDGSTVQFMKHVASTAGFGMYETQLSHVATMQEPLDSYAACLVDIELGMTDICIGPFWNSIVEEEEEEESEDKDEADSSSEGDADGGDSAEKIGHSLYVDGFYLVVPKYKETTLDMLRTPINPFAWDAWLFITISCLFMGIVMHCMRPSDNTSVNNGDTTTPHRGVGLCNQIGNVIFNSLRSCTSGDVGSNKSDPPVHEKIVISGFVIFGLIILTAYTATSAAFLVSVGTTYNSPSDLINEAGTDKNICIAKRAESLLIQENQDFRSKLVGKPYNTSKLLDLVDTDDCFAVVVPSGDIAYLARKEESTCEKVNVLINSELLKLDIIIPTFEMNEGKGTELSEIIRSMIEEGIYSNYHQSYRYIFDSDDVEYVKDTSRRQLKGGRRKSRKGSKGAAAASAAAGGGSNTASQFFGTSCGSAAEIDLDKFQLTEFHLLMPISLSLFLTTLGLALFYCEQVKDSTAVKRGVAEMQVLEYTDDEQDQLLLQELQNEKPYDLIDGLQCIGSIDDAAIFAAINELPNRQKLIELAFRALSSQRAQNCHIISALDASELCLLVEHYRMINVHVMFDNNSFDEHTVDFFTATNHNGSNRRTSMIQRMGFALKSSPQYVEEAMNDPEDPKGALIKDILDYPVLKRMALRCARIKEKVTAEGSEVFEIEQYIDDEQGDDWECGEQRSEIHTLQYLNREKTTYRLQRSNFDGLQQDEVDGHSREEAAALHSLRLMNRKNLRKSEVIMTANVAKNQHNNNF